MARSKKPTPLADIEKPFMQKMKHIAYPFGALSAIIIGLLLFLSPAVATLTLWLIASPYMLYLCYAINAEGDARMAIYRNDPEKKKVSLPNQYFGEKLGVTFLTCLLGTFIAVMMHKADVAERAELLAGQNAEKEKIAAEQIEKQNKKDSLAWQGDNLAFRCIRKDLTVTTTDGSEKLLEIFIQHDAYNEKAKIYMTGVTSQPEIVEVDETENQFSYDGGLYEFDTRRTAQRTDPIAQRTFSYTVSGKRINELKLNRIDGKLKFEDSIDDEYSYLRTIDCKKIESVAFSSQTAALRDEAIEAGRRADLKEEAERAELKAKRKF
jgi:hypothetical protein